MTLLTKNTEALKIQVKAHFDADEIIKGKYWEDGKGCAVGCMIHSSNHEKFPDALGWPSCVAHLMDAIFESLPNGTAKNFPLRVTEAVGEDGKDLSMVVPQWIYWTLTDNVKPTKYPQYQAFIDAVVAMYEEWTRTGVRPADLAYRADLADRADLAYRADLADRADLAYRAYRADLADRAYLAYRADLADRADLAYRADLASASADKFIELLKAAPIVDRSELRKEMMR